MIGLKPGKWLFYEVVPVIGRWESRTMKFKPQYAPKHGATYTRMSEDHQPSSPGQQMAAIHKYAKRRGLKIVKNYSDGAEGGWKA